MPFNRGFNRGFRGFKRNFGPREMHKIKCSECGKEDEVPFKPMAGKPVFCKECFMKKKGISPSTRKPRESEKAEEETEESEDLEESKEEAEEETEEI